MKSGPTPTTYLNHSNRKSSGTNTGLAIRLPDASQSRQRPPSELAQNAIAEVGMQKSEVGTKRLVRWWFQLSIAEGGMQKSEVRIEKPI